MTLAIPPTTDPDALYEAFTAWTAATGIELYPHQDESLLHLVTGTNVIVTTPTGSGKSLIATAAHFVALAGGGRTYYTAPIKALVNEKFFALCDIFGAAQVGMVTGDAAVNADAPIVCCTAEILANIALRSGAEADIAQVIMDEFHFIADPDRGWAWQVPLVELPQAQFVIMSATLGDVTELAEQLATTTGRPTEIVGNAARPVPLSYRWATTAIHETIAELVAEQQAPVYVVHPTQGAAIEQAQALLSQGVVKDHPHRDELKQALAGFKFGGGFGTTLRKLLAAGIGVHHAGLLPRYRRLVEQLTQRGLLAVVCGTDTLGVGINVPIRTVLFSSLTKFDGRRQRVLRSREFHQIAGRAGRAGFDTVGYVVGQAPEHEVANVKILAKHAGDAKKLKSVRRKKPPEGFLNYTQATFDKLVESQPEQLHARMRISHALLLNLLQRDEDTAVVLQRLIDSCVTDPKVRRSLLRRAVQLGRSLLRADIATRLEQPTAGGRRYGLNVDLQRDFALNQPLSAFALEVITVLDQQSPTWALDVVSVIEATLENPKAVLLAQQFKAKGEVAAELKADGVEYDERMEILEDVSWPQPLAELLDDALEEFAAAHPWVSETPISPKSIARDMYEQAMTFGEYVAHYKLQRSEGLLLRYLSDALRALRQTVPESLRTDEMADFIAWLGEITRLTDSSLIDEWAKLAELADDRPGETTATPTTRAFSANTRALRVLVRNAMWRQVELCAADDVTALAALTSGTAMTRQRWDEALGDYWDEHDVINTGPDARGPAFFVVEEQRQGRVWQVHQILADPAGNRDWAIHAVVDLDECDQADDLALTTTDLSRQD